MTLEIDIKSTLPAKRKGAPVENQNALKEGLYTHDRNALRLRARSVRRLVNHAYQQCPWLKEPDLPTVRAWAEVIKLKAIAFVALERLGVYRVDGKDLAPRRMLGEYRHLAAQELAYAKELGFTPASRAAMRVDALQGDDLAARAAKLRNGHDQ